VDVGIELNVEPFQNGIKFEIVNNPLLIKKFRALAYRNNYNIKVTAEYKPAGQPALTSTLMFDKIELMGDGAKSGSIYGNPPLNA
jgi:hypothetical protein